VKNKPHSGQDRLSLDANPFDALLEKPHEPKPPGTLSETAPATAKAKPVEGIVVGHLVGLAEDGGFLVQFPGNPGGQPVRALAATEISERRVGSPVALSFVEGNIHQPLILGFILVNANETAGAGKQTLEVQQDGKRLVISAENELVLKCGDSTITLTKAGKVLIRGKYLLSRAEGVNRIKGGAVQIN
jgi:hypothetical protein